MRTIIQERAVLSSRVAPLARPILPWVETGGGYARHTLPSAWARRYARLLTASSATRADDLSAFLTSVTPLAHPIANKIVDQGPPCLWIDLADAVRVAAAQGEFVIIHYEWGIPFTAQPLSFRLT